MSLQYELSIIIPVYNVEKYVRRCIESVIKIANQNIEIILINDGSTDNSQAICEEYLRQDNRIKLINQDNGGLSYSRNKGIELAEGEYIAFIDSDDWIDSQSFTELFNKIKEDNLDIIYGEYSLVNSYNIERVCKKHTYEVCNGIELLELNIHNDSAPVEVVTNIYKKSFLDKYSIRFVKRLLHEDTLFSLMCYLYAERVKCLPINFYNYFIRDNSIMRTISFKNYLCQLYISERLHILKTNNNIKSKAWDTVIFSLYFDSVRHGKVKNPKLYNVINNKLNLTLRSRIKQMMLPYYERKAKEIDYYNLIDNYFHEG